MNLDRWTPNREAVAVAERLERARAERQALERLARDPEAEPAIVLFRPGDVCGDCGAPLTIHAPDRASCPNHGCDPLPF